MTLKTSNIFIAVAVAATLSTGAQAAADLAGVPDISLEDLLKVDVITASRKTQSVQGVAAAVYVISREDIERSGATSLPEVLRMAPGVEVARLSSGRWAVSARGFNGRFANKLLVLMDGRSIYSPLFSGVLWEMEGTLLEDIERIEIIRGPSAALWGANAVNGVINILTRHTRDTQGTLVALGAGNIESGSAAVRVGSATDSGHYRVWAKTEASRGFNDASGAQGNDAWHTSRAGFRADTTLASGNGLSLSGSIASNLAGDRWYEANVNSPVGISATEHTQQADAAHLLARYNRLEDDGSETIAQAYVENSNVQVTNAFSERRTTLDLDVQHHPRLNGIHDVVLGATYRYSSDNITSSGIINISPESRDFSLASVFINDEITLLPEKLRATLGARLEYNSFTGFEPQPQARLAWTPSRTQTIWSAVSRAVRTPSRAEPDATVDLAVTPANAQVPFPVLIRNMPPANHSKLSETVEAFELGYRQQFGSNVSVDLTAFENHYSRLSAASLGAFQLPTMLTPYGVQYITPGNVLEGRTYGWELALDWRAQPDWRLQAAYSHLKANITSASGDPIEVAAAATASTSAPQHQLTLRSSLSMGNGREFDAKVRYVSAVLEGKAGTAPIDAYTALDLRYAWRPQPKLTLSITGENLLQSQHTEFVPDLLPSQTLQVPRSVHFKALWQF